MSFYKMIIYLMTSDKLAHLPEMIGSIKAEKINSQILILPAPTPQTVP